MYWLINHVEPVAYEPKSVLEVLTSRDGERIASTSPGAIDVPTST